MPRGGRREGAGRPKGTGKFGEPTKAVRLPISMIEQVMEFIDQKGFQYPLFSTQQKTAFTNPMEQVPDERIKIVNYLDLSESTICVRMADESMSGAGINTNDVLVVDQRQKAKHGDVVVAVVDGKATAKRLIIKGKKMELKPENPKFATIIVANPDEVTIWGVVIHVVHSLSSPKK